MQAGLYTVTDHFDQYGGAGDDVHLLQPVAPKGHGIYHVAFVVLCSRSGGEANIQSMDRREVSALEKYLLDRASFAARADVKFIANRRTYLLGF